MPGPKLNAITHDKIVDAVRHGSFMKHAAYYAGIDPATLSVWLDKGSRATAGRYRDFYLAVQQAKGEAVMVGLNQLHVAMSGGQVLERSTVRRTNGDVETREKYAPVDARAVQFYLTAGPGRDEWRNASSKSVEVSGPDGGPIQVEANHVEALALKVEAFRAQQTEVVDAEPGDEPKAIEA